MEEEYLDHKDYESIGINQTHKLYEKKIQKLIDSLKKHNCEFIQTKSVIKEIEEKLK